MAMSELNFPEREYDSIEPRMYPWMRADRIELDVTMTLSACGKAGNSESFPFASTKISSSI